MFFPIRHFYPSINISTIRNPKFKIPNSIFSNSIHKGRFNPIKQQQPGDQDHQGEGGAVEEAGGADSAGTQVGVAEALHHRGERVEPDDPLEPLGDRRDRVDDRGGVHPELDPEAHQEAEVAVAGGQGGDDDPESEPHARHQEQQQGGEQYPQVGLDLGASQPEIDHKSQEEQELDNKGDQAGDDDADWDCQAREVDLAEQAGVAHKGEGGLVQAVGEIGPDHDAGQVEQEGRQPVGRQACQAPEDDCEDQGGQQWLDQVPERAQDGLLVD